ncbi:hypothetical protein BLOT_010659, partial [Blomia tropicalis]
MLMLNSKPTHTTTTTTTTDTTITVVLELFRVAATPRCVSANLPGEKGNHAIGDQARFVFAPFPIATLATLARIDRAKRDECDETSLKNTSTSADGVLTDVCRVHSFCVASNAK